MRVSQVVSVLRAAGDTVQLEITSGAFEVGGLLVHQGAVWHAEVPGAEGPSAYALLTRVPAGHAAFRESAPAGRRTVGEGQQPALEAVDEELTRAVQRGRAIGHLALGDPQRQVAPRSSVGNLSLPPDAVPAPPGRSSAEVPLSALSAEERAVQEEYEAAFRDGTQAYLRHDFPTARGAFERCLKLRPNDRRALHNLERLKSK